MMRPANLLSVLLLLLLTSCAVASQTTPTPVIAPDLAGLDEAPLDALKTPSPVPFQFNIPAPGAEPVSGWRPPLYPIPWAKSAYDHFYFARPIAADEVNWPIPDYRYGGVFFAPNIVHTGIDIDAEEDSPILAAGPGTVVWVGWGLFTETPGNLSDPYGIAVAIKHDFGYNDQQLYTIYAHMNEAIAVMGQHVEMGEVIGLVGATGATTGPHVHFEVRYPTNSFHHTYNPELWIAPPQGWGVLVGRVMDSEGKTLQSYDVTVRSEVTRKSFFVKTYGLGGATNMDPYYQENLVLGDLPAGIYKITLEFDEKNVQTWMEIFPGQVTYFTFKGELGYSTEWPADPRLDFLPTVTFTPAASP
jgi:murein DD-endopeptidase MepM/ murein hydrolase activator NlpD